MPSAIEDPNGLAITLSIENILRRHVVKMPEDKVASMYPVASIIAVKEPYVCLGGTTGIAEIRVSVPTDIVPLPKFVGRWRFKIPVRLDRKHRI